MGTERKKSPVVIPGFHAVREALCSGRRQVKEVWVAEGKKGTRIKEILQRGEAQGIAILYKTSDTLDRLARGIPHQGIIALAAPFAYAGFEEVAERSLKGPGYGLILAADHITDEGNLGAIIRGAAFFGVQGLVLPKNRSARVTPGVLKRSSGAFVHLPIAQVVNLGRALDLLRKKGFWIIGTAGEVSESIQGFDWNRSVVLVLGSEEKGLSHGIRERCDQLVSIPGTGRVESLNVSVACGVILAEINRQRRKERDVMR